MELNFPLLRAKDIDCRAATVRKNGLSLLLYKNARVDMAMLDKVVGPLNWKREHSRENANCTVSIWDEFKSQWVSKEDTGTESNTEAAKGLASDSFKRACFNWGIGRELYTAPFIWINAGQAKIEERGERCVCYDRFEVDRIEYNDDREIVFLVVVKVDSKGRTPVYSYGQPAQAEEYITEKELTVLRTLCEKKGYTVEKVFPAWPKLTPAQYTEALRRLNA